MSGLKDSFRKGKMEAEKFLDDLENPPRGFTIRKGSERQKLAVVCAHSQKVEQWFRDHWSEDCYPIPRTLSFIILGCDQDRAIETVLDAGFDCSTEWR